MAVQAGNQSEPPPDARRRAVGRIAAALIPAVPFGLCAGPVVASLTGWAIWDGVAVGGLMGLVLGLVVGTADWLGLQELLRRRKQAPGAEPVAPPEPAA